MLLAIDTNHIETDKIELSDLEMKKGKKFEHATKKESKKQ